MSCYREFTFCVVSKKNWGAKEDNGKFMMHVLYILWLTKRHISDEATPNNEEVKPVA